MPIPAKLREEMANDPYYKSCARKGSDCSGRITWEHSFIYKNQIQERWAIIPLCWYHHLGDGLNKELNQYLALKRADIEDLCKRMPRKDWKQIYSFLNKKYAK